MPLVFGKSSYSIPFIVADHMKYNGTVLIGLQSLHKMKVVIQTGSLGIIVDNQFFPFISKYESPVTAITSKLTDENCPDKQKKRKRTRPNSIKSNRNNVSLGQKTNLSFSNAINTPVETTKPILKPCMSPRNETNEWITSSNAMVKTELSQIRDKFLCINFDDVFETTNSSKYIRKFSMKRVL